MIDLISPLFRGDPLAADFGEALAEGIDWTPADFGGGWAWEAQIPPRSEWAAEIGALQAHLDTL